MTSDAWYIIGFFGSPARDSVPKVLTAAVLDPSGQRVAISDVANNEAELRKTEWMSPEEFQECLALASATSLPPVMWEPQAVLLLMDGDLERVSCWEAEFRLNRFVQAMRERAEQAVSNLNLEEARELFDRARRVSNDEEDAERCAELEPDPAIRTYMLAALA